MLSFLSVLSFSFVLIVVRWAGMSGAGARQCKQLAWLCGDCIAPVGTTRVTVEGTCGCVTPELLRQRLEVGVQ